MAKQLSVIPLGGVTEIGKNMFVIRYGDDIIIIDSGLMFPEEEMLGIDIVIPDMTYLFENKKRIKGVFLTHGHEDHIGSLSYLLREVDVPVYGTGLTLAIVSSKLEENKVEFKSGLREVMPGDKIKAGAVQVEYIRINQKRRSKNEQNSKIFICRFRRTGNSIFRKTSGLQWINSR